jgi:hypothetical protein
MRHCRSARFAARGAIQRDTTRNTAQMLALTGNVIEHPTE